MNDADRLQQRRITLDRGLVRQHREWRSRVGGALPTLLPARWIRMPGR